MLEEKFEQHLTKLLKRSLSAIEQSKQTKRVQSWDGEVEWYTPRRFLDAAIEVMGNIRPRFRTPNMPSAKFVN